MSANLIKSTLEQAHYQKLRLQEFQQRDYPFANCTKLLGILIKIHDDLIKNLSTILEKAVNNVSDLGLQEDAETATQRYKHFFSFLHLQLDLFEFSTRENISQGTVYLFEGLVERFHEQDKFILVPTYDFNYSYFDILRHIIAVAKKIIPEIESLIQTDIRKMGIIAYPNTYRDNVITNSLLSHEVGHHIVEQNESLSNFSINLRLMMN